jgi:small conductance mechanosensitive channel
VFTVQNAWNTISGVVNNLIAAAAVFLVILLLARILRRVIGAVLARRSVRSDAALLATRAVYLGVIGLGLMMFAAIALGNVSVGVVGVLIAAALTSLGLQDLIKSYVSGFYVLMEKNVRVGDLVENGGYMGVVTDVQMRVTHMRGAHGEMIVVPNSELFTRTLMVSEAPPNWGSGTEGAEHDSDQGVEGVAR